MAEVTTPEGACPGPCNHRYRRAWKVYRAARAAWEKQAAEAKDGAELPDPPRPPDLYYEAGKPVWCGTCAAMLAQQLADLDDLASRLAFLPPGIRPAAANRAEPVKVSGTRSDPSPSPAADTLDDLGGWMRGWERVTRPVIAPGTQVPRRGELSTEITAITGWLGAHLRPILAMGAVDPASGQMYAELFGSQLGDWHRILVAATHSGAEPKHFKQPCPGCKRYSLWEYPGETFLRCVNQSCNARPTREEVAAA